MIVPKPEDILQRIRQRLFYDYRTTFAASSQISARVDGLFDARKSGKWFSKLIVVQVFEYGEGPYSSERAKKSNLAEPMIFRSGTIKEMLWHVAVLPILTNE